MADTNPFANALRPDTGGLPGFIGGMMGVPTTAQAQGGATGSALAAIANLRANGKTTQEAAMEFFKTPAGQDFFTNAGPDGLKNLQSGLTAMQPPAPTLNNVAPGGMLTSTDQNGNTRTVASNPQQFPNQVLGPQDQQRGGKGELLSENTNIKGDEPADVRSFKFFTQLGKVPKDEIQRFAALKADPTPNDPNSVKNQAIQRMLDNGWIDAPLAESLRAETIQVTPLTNDFGQQTGNITVYNKAFPEAGTRMLTPKDAGAASSAPIVAPGTSPSTGGAAGVLPPVKPDKSATSGNPSFGSKDNMALGASPVSKVLGAATKLSETIDPRLIIEQGAQANDRQTLLDTLRSNLQSIGTIGGGMSSNKGLIEGYVRTYLDEGFLSASPHSQVQKLIRLHENATKNIEEESTRAKDKALPNEVRKQASETVAGWQRVLSSMPTYDTLVKQEDAIRKGTAGAPTIGGAAKTLLEGGAKALTEGKKQASDVAGVAGKVDIDKINDPKELLAIDPRTLDRQGKIKYLRKIDSLKKGMSSGPTNP